MPCYLTGDTTIKKLLFFIFIISSFYCIAENMDATESSNESQNQYKLLADEYQQKANYYKGLSGIYESQPTSNKLLTALAPPKKENEYNPWQGSLFGVGGGNVTGDSANTNFSGNFILNYKQLESSTGWNSNSIGQYDYLSAQGSPNKKNRLYLQQNNSYMYDKFNGLFGQVSYLNDANDGYNYVWNENIGYQLQLFNNDDMNLLLNVGPGLQQRELTTGIGNETQPQWLTQATYNLRINEVLTFYEQLQNTATATNNTTYSISQINLLVGNGFSIGINYQITYNTQAPQGKSPTTTITSFQVNYGIY